MRDLTFEIGVVPASAMGNNGKLGSRRSRSCAFCGPCRTAWADASHSMPRDDNIGDVALITRQHQINNDAELFADCIGDVGADGRAS